MCRMLHRALRPLRRGPLSVPELALVGITAVWGTTFLIVHLAMEHSGPMFFVAVRFLTAGVVGLVVFRRALRRMTVVEIGAGTAIGVTIALGYGLQTYGLQTIAPSTSAFITALYVPVVPLLEWTVLRRTPKPMTLVGVALALLGLVLLAGPGASGVGLGRGEVATLASAVAVAAEIILIGRFAGRVHLGRITVVQLLSAGAFAALAMPVTGEHVPPFSWWWCGGAVGLGLASCLIQLTMNWAQRSVSPTRATIIYTGEPVWGGIVGRIAGDRLPALALVGAVLIVAGVLVSELSPTRRKTSSDQPAEAAPVGFP